MMPPRLPLLWPCLLTVAVCIAPSALAQMDGGPESSASPRETSPSEDKEAANADKDASETGSVTPTDTGAPEPAPAEEGDPKDAAKAVAIDENITLPPLKRVSVPTRADAIIGTSKVIVDQPKPDEERQLSSYLLRFLGKKATDDNLLKIENWLLRLDRYRAAVCRYTGSGKARLVRCGVTRAPTIRSVSLEGLPATLLEADVMRRVFLRPGEVLDDKDERGQTRIARQEERLERYLERKGLYGALVRVLSPPVSKSTEIDVVIRVVGGSFVGVRSVLVQTPLPFERETVVSTYNTMCGGEGLLEGFETFHLNCFTKERTRDVTDALEADLRARGYPEGRVRVRPIFVGIDDDPRNGIVDRARRSARRNVANPGVADSLPFVVRSKPSDDDAGDDGGDDADNQGDGGRDDSGEGAPRSTPNGGSQAPTVLLREARANLNVPGVDERDAVTSKALSLPMTESCRPLPPLRGQTELTPRCVDLVVDVLPGPHLVAQIDIVGRDRKNTYTTDPFAALTPGFAGLRDLVGAGARIFKGAFVGPSRVVQLVTERPLRSSADTAIELDELKGALTFNESRSTDQTEAYVSAQSLRFALQKLGYFFAGVYVDHQDNADRVDVVFEVDPGDPVAVSKIVFHGLDHFSEEDIRGELDFATKVRTATTTGFVTQLDLENDRRRLLHFFEARGFVEANVDVDAERIAPDQIAVNFRVTEGGQWTVADIQMEGIPSSLVDEIVQSLEHCRNGVATMEGRKPRVPSDCAGSPFRPSDADALALERQRVLNVFVAEGFPYATAEIAPVDFKPGGGVVLKITVHPDGERAQRRPQLSAPNTDDTKAAAANRSSTEEDIVKEGEAVVAVIDDMVNLPDANADNAEGRVRLGEIFIDGNHISARDVMLRELAITGDKVLRPRKIAEGVSRLRRTGLYSRVELDFVGIEEHTDRVHLLIQVEERPTVTVDTSLGFSTDRLFSWRLEARDRNFAGTMFDVSGLLDFGLFIGRYTQAQVLVRWPRILGSRIDLRVTPSFVYEDRPSTDIPRIPTDDDPQLAVGVWTVDQFRRRQARIGQVLGIEYQPLEKSDALTLSLDFEQRLEWTDNLAKPLTPFSLEALQTVDGMTLAFQQCVLPVSTVTPKVTLRDLDNPFDPKRGYRLEGSVMLGHPILGVACDRSGPVSLNDLDVLGEWVGLLSASATGYYTLGRFTFAGNIRGWTGVARSDDRFFQSSLIRNQSLLAVGGDRSVRGFNQDDVGLKAYSARPDEGIAVYDEDNILSLSGGVLNLEVRTTLLPNFFIGDLNGAAFVDVGLVTDTLNLPWFSPRDMWSQLSAPNDTYVDPRLGVGVGVGLRYVLPVGPISADFAIRPDPVVDALFGLQPRNPAFDVHFQLGYVF